MTSARESRLPTSALTGIPTAGSKDSNRRKSFLPGPKSFTASKIKAPSDNIPAPLGKLQSTSKCNTTFAVPSSVVPQSKSLVRQSSNNKIFVPGDKCCISGVKKGSIRYFGKVHFAEGEWCGIELNEAEGKHDGIVDSVRYFTCKEKHGLFAPVAKVELISSATAVVKLSKDSTTNQRRTSTLLKPGQLLSVGKTEPGNLRSRSRSPIEQKKRRETTEADKSNSLSIKNQGRLSLGGKCDLIKQRSKSPYTLNKIKTDLKSASINIKAGSKSKFSGITVDKSETCKTGKVKHLPPKSKGKVKSPKTDSSIKEGKIVKKNVRSERKISGNTTKNSEATSVNIQNTTFVKDKTILNESNLTENDCKLKPEIQTKLNITYSKDLTQTSFIIHEPSFLHDSPISNVSFAPKTPIRTVQSPPVPDLVQPQLCHESDSILDFAGDIMSEPEEKDILTTSQISHASSLGLLSDNQLVNCDLLSTKYESVDPAWNSAIIKKCNQWIENEIDDKELDLEIAGISTPEQDVSSRSSTGREDSSPEPDVTQPAVHTTLELTFQVDHAKTSTPTSPTKIEPKNINEFQGVKPKFPGHLQKTFVKCKSPLAACSNENIHKKPLNSTYVALKDGNANEVKENDDRSPEEYPKRMKTSSEFDRVENALSASFELAKTAVTQYANLVKGAELERALSLRKKDQRLSLIEIRSSSFDLGDTASDKKLRHSFHEDLLRNKPNFHTDIGPFYLEKKAKSFEKSPLELKHNNEKQLIKADNTDSVHNNIDPSYNGLKQTLSTHKIDGENHIGKLSSSCHLEGRLAVNLSHSYNNSIGDNINKRTKDTHGERTHSDENEHSVSSSYDDGLPSSELNTPGDYVELIKPEDRKTIKQGVFGNTTSKQEVIKIIGEISGDTLECINNSNLPASSDQIVTDRQTSIDDKKKTSDDGNNLVKSSNSFVIEGERHSVDTDNVKERLVSLVSSSSVDTGIYSEDNGGDPVQQLVSRESSFSCGMDRSNSSVDGGCELNGSMQKQQDRPVSAVSTTSVDTGYQPDFESEHTVSATASSANSLESGTLKDDVKNVLSQESPSVDEDEKVTKVYKDDTESMQSLDPDSATIDNKDFPEEMAEAADDLTSETIHEDEFQSDGSKQLVMSEPQPEVSCDDSTDERNDFESGENKDPEVKSCEKQPSEVLRHMADMSVDKETEDEINQIQAEKTNEATEAIQNTIRDTFIVPNDIQEEVSTVPQDISVDNENNEANNINTFAGNLLHNEDTQNENEEYFEDEVIPVRKVEDDLDMIETQSADTEPPLQKGDELDMLDMSWDNTEFNQMRDKIINDGTSSDVDGIADSEIAESENMETEFHDPCKSDDVSSAREDVLSSGEGDTSIKSVKGPQKRKSKSGFVSVKETKSSKLRISRESPEKVVEKESKVTKIGSPQKDSLSKLPSSKVPVTGTSPSKLKRHSYAGITSQQKLLNTVENTQQSGPDKNKSAISNKPQSRLSSHLRRPSNPIPGSSLGNVENKSLNPGESKLKSKLYTKSIQKRKTDFSSSANPVPSKKAASYSSNKTSANPKHSTADGASTTSKQNDLNSSVTSAHSAGSKVSVDSGNNSPISKKNPGAIKSRVASLNKTTKADGESGPGKTGIKSRLGVPQAKGKKGEDKEEQRATSPRPGSKITKPPTAGQSTSTRSRISGPSSKGSSRLVTSTPKSGGSSQLQSGSGLVNGVGNDTTDLNVSDMNYSGIKSKTLTGRPPHRATMSLKSRERSISIGSDSQISIISTVSSLSNISRVSSQGSSRPIAGRNSIAGTNYSGVSSFSSSQQSRRLPGLKKRSNSTEPKRTGLSVTAAGKIGTKSKPSTASQPLAASSPKKATNQNRNKAGAAPTRPSSQGASKRSQQSNNLVNNAAAREEISRLEALCESRTKELNYAKMQLKQSAAGFEAMSVLVKYLTEELDAFSLPEVNAKLQETEERLSEAEKQLAELTCQRDALIEEIKCLKDEHQLATDRIEEEHKNNIETLRNTLTAQKQQEVAKVNEEHTQLIRTLESSHEDQIEDLRQEHDEFLEEKCQEHENALACMNAEKENIISELQKQHADALGDITKRFEDIKMNLSEKVECLRGECEMLRKREKEYMESFQRDSDQKVHIALRPYQHLPQEIESLKAVMEMKNQEIHALRREKLDHERQLEALPKAHDKIRSLQQKNENLEAIINIRTDYERSLAEKHQELLRKFDKESKANKRLSMEHEEIQWRISQAPEELQSVLNRSISHSPTSSAASTPEPTRRKKSPHPSQSPRSPRTSGSEFDKLTRSPRGSTSDLDKRSSTRSLKSNNDFNSPRSSGSDFDRTYSPRNSGSDYSRCNDSYNSPFIMSTSTQSEPAGSVSATQMSNLKRSDTYELLNEEAELNGGHSPTSNSKQTDV